MAGKKSKSTKKFEKNHLKDTIDRRKDFKKVKRRHKSGRKSDLKSAYEGIVRGSRNTTAHTLPEINLMKDSTAEIWANDPKVGYTTGFTSIRQLAIHLRSNITKPSKDSYKTIYNWQFIHSLDFWSRVLSMHCNPLVEAQATTTTSAKKGKGDNTSPLRPLIYPLVQLSLGTLRLIPTPAYFPLRFHIIRSLLRLASATDTFIPLAPSLLEVLNSSEMKKPPKPATLKPLDFATTLRAPAGYLRTRVYQDGVAEQVVELLAEFFVQWAKSIAFPELQLPVTVMLRRWLKAVSSSSTTFAPSKNNKNMNKYASNRGKEAGGNRNIKIQRQVSLLIQKLDANARWIEERRNQVQFSPRDATEVRAFLKDTGWEETPLGAFVKGQRAMREERARVLRESREEEEADKDGDGDGEEWAQPWGGMENDEEEVGVDGEVEEEEESMEVETEDEEQEEDDDDDNEEMEDY